MKLVQRGWSVLLAISLLLCGTMLQGLAVDTDDFDVRRVGENLVITAYGGADTAVVIPAQIGGRTVVGLDSEAFAENSSIRSITIPETITELADEQFSICTSLQQVHLSEGLTKIGVSAFYGCTSLRSIVIPDSVTTIGVSAFADCAALETVQIGNGVTTIPARLFDNCTSLKTVCLGQKVTGVADNAFQLCFSKGGDLYVFGSRTEIPKSVFEGTSGLVVHCYPGSAAEKQAVENGFDSQTFKPVSIYAVCDQELSVSASDQPQQPPKDGVRVFARFEQAGTAVPDLNVTKDAVFPASQVFDVPGSANVTVQYAGLSAVYAVRVIDNKPEPVQLRLVTDRMRLEYPVMPTAQTLDYTGLKVLLVYSDTQQEDVTAKAVMPKTALLDAVGSGEAQRIRVSYTPDGGKELTADIQLSVLPDTLQRIEVVNSPAGTTYFTADNAQRIDTTGLRVQAVYTFTYLDKNTNQSVSYITRKTDVTGACTVPDQILRTAGTTQVPVQFGGVSTRFPVTVAATQIHLTADGKTFSGTYKRKIPLFGSYQSNPVAFAYTANEGMRITDVRWSVAENNRMRIQDGTLTMRGLFAGAGRVTLQLTDNHGGVHTVSASVLLYRFNLLARIFFAKYF